MSRASRRPPRFAAEAATTAERPRRREWIALGVGVLGVCALLYVLPQAAELANTRGYRAVPATLTGVERQISPAHLAAPWKKLRLFPERKQSIVYRYTVAGQSYEAADTVPAVPKGPLTVYYYPQEPARSVAHRPAALPVIAAAVVPLALLAYGFRGLRGARGRPAVR